MRLPNNWRPRSYQLKLWRYLENGGTRAVGVWHRRAGKDDVCLHWAATALHERIGNYWHMLPQQAQGRKAIWNAVNPHSSKRRIDEAFPKALRATTLENEMMIRFKNGSTWQVIGSDNYDSLVGSPPVGITFSEWALADPQAWAYLRPILRENGGWALFIYTPRGRNHGATFFEAAREDPTWFAQRLTAEETSVFSKHDLDVERREYIREYGPDDGESRFRQEYFCDFDVAVVGSYYGTLLRQAEQDDRITAVPHDPNLSVETWWDLGIGDSTAIWFIQRVSGTGTIRIIDYYEASGKGLAHYARILTEKAKERDMIYGDHVWPHDGAARDISTGETRADTMEGLGFPVVIMPREDIGEGIHAVRRLLPMMWFDRERTKKGLDGLRQYRRQWDEKKKSFQDTPFHDWASHPADAMRTGARYRPDDYSTHTPPRLIKDYPATHPVHGVV